MPDTKNRIVLSQTILLAVQATQDALELIFGNKVRFQDCTLMPRPLRQYLDEADHFGRAVEISGHVYGMPGRIRPVSLQAKIFIDILRRNHPRVSISPFSTSVFKVDGVEYRGRWQSDRGLKIQKSDANPAADDEWTYSPDYEKPKMLPPCFKIFGQ